MAKERLELKPPEKYRCPNCNTIIEYGEFGSYTCPNDDCGHQEYDDTDFECPCDYCSPPEENNG